MSAIPSWARVGAKVVCVDAGPTSINGQRLLKAGAVYTVTWVGFDAGKFDAWPTPGLKVAGVQRRLSFRIDRFKPLVTLEHDIATHFVRLLDVPTSHEVDA